MSLRDEPLIRTGLPEAATVVKIAGITLLLWIVSGYTLSMLGYTGMFLSELVLLVPVLLFIIYNKIDIKRALRLQPISLYIGLFSIISGAALTVLSNVIHVVFNKIYPMPMEMENMLENMLVLNTLGDFVLVILASIVAASICEELFFRGFLQAHLERRWHPLKAIAFSSVLFCLLHPIWWMPSTLFNGIVLGMMAYVTRSVYPGIIIHMIHNGLAVGLSQLSLDRSIWVMESFILEPSIVVGSIVILSGSLLYFFRRGFLNSEQASVLPDAHFSDNQV